MSRRTHHHGALSTTLFDFTPPSTVRHHSMEVPFQEVQVWSVDVLVWIPALRCIWLGYHVRFNVKTTLDKRLPSVRMWLVLLNVHGLFTYIDCEQSHVRRIPSGGEILLRIIPEPWRRNSTTMCTYSRGQQMLWFILA